MRVLVVLVCVGWAGVIGAGASRAAAPDTPCARYAAAPERVFHGDDFEFVHAAGSAMYCPDGVHVQITACVQRDTPDGWVDLGCVTSPGTDVTSHTSGGRGQAVSFDVPCVSGVLRTRVTGGEGLEPAAWDSSPATIACLGSGGLDTVPPQTTVVSGPPALTNDGSPSFGFISSEAGSTFACRLDDAGWANCSAPKHYGSLADGAHAFRVRATDLAGNTDPSPALRSFTLDTTPPQTTLERSGAAFTFSSEPGATFACRLDGGGWTACASPRSFEGASAGEHSFDVRATDVAGNTGPAATMTWTVATPTPSPTTSPEPSPSPTADPTPTADPEPNLSPTADPTTTLTPGSSAGASVPAAAPGALSPRADRTGPAIVIPARNRSVTATRRGVVRFLIGPVDEGASGTLTLAAPGLALGAARFRIRAGETVGVRVSLSRRGGLALQRRRRLDAKATLTLRDAAGNATIEVFRSTLRAPRR